MNDKDKPAVISRLSTIFLCLLTECPSACHESTGFLYNLLEFVDNTGVYDLFKEIFKKDSELRVIQEFLVETKLTTYIVRILREHENLETIKCMLRLISHGANNKIMWPSFCSDEVCEALIFRSGIEEIKNELWEAVNAVVCTKNVQTMKNIIPQAINLITTTYMKPTAALAYSFDFLSKIIRRSVESFTVESVNQLLSSIISLLAIVPDSSNLLGAAFRLITSCVKIKNFTQPTLDMVLPVLAAEAPSRVRCAATANCANFILNLQDMASKDAELFKLLTKYEDYQEICSRFLPWYSNVISSNYRGVISIYDKGSPLMGTFSLI
ncbi:hypothetical protein TVAG_269270 [Trichomonas vaginalis G3]|uniref:Uncharacterized protein n=1 Tax=Trichomonas vaginalis (strain ATCC PRA-98 / G3) TaxID=412133 RepID=A2EG40_TRIV3|nr:armadillo (ARM) repeat-containing protein family [Trichomonas vaginalis G3]EAY08401.1 hypothetical protein TVAG_269270 [Trichomonas vaginalis G3]KAI5499316.1 armadillo (ARM) repeat-containing protein family [Trichomonas vaginalis G3]|eukprot:XP_001320624.1 hypothetical protein [Trichomonas vaginalis G3]